MTGVSGVFLQQFFRSDLIFVKVKFYFKKGVLSLKMFAFLAKVFMNNHVLSINESELLSNIRNCPLNDKKWLR